MSPINHPAQRYFANSFIREIRIPAKTFLVFALWCVASVLGAATVNVSIQDSDFSPSSVTVSPGDTVVWTNMGATNHSSTSGKCCTIDGKWDSGTLKPGDAFSFTFPAPGN